MEKQQFNFEQPEMIIKLEPDALSTICDSTVSDLTKFRLTLLGIFGQFRNYKKNLGAKTKHRQHPATGCYAIN